MGRHSPVIFHWKDFNLPLRRTWDQPRSGVDNARIDLGKKLYFDKRLSRDNSISCNSCHDLKTHGVDGRAFSLGFKDHEVGRNSPTVFNAAGHIAQFWDGRATTVEEQAKGPILAAGEMAMPSPEAVVKKLKEFPATPPCLPPRFRRTRTRSITTTSAPPSATLSDCSSRRRAGTCSWPAPTKPFRRWKGRASSPLPPMAARPVTPARCSAATAT